jgi:hypothetical protein
MTAALPLWRRGIATALVVVATLLVFVALLALWLNRQALNTDNWAKTSSELLEQPVVQARLAERLTDELFASTDVVAALEDVLPPRAEALAGPAANALRTQVEKTARRALARPDVQALWVDANRAAHEQLMTVLDGGGTTISTQNGDVVVDVKALLAELQRSVGVGGRLRKVLPASATQLRVFRSDQLGTAQDVVRVLRPLPVILLLAAFALVAVAMAVVPGRRRTTVRAFGIGFVVAGLAGLLTRSVAGDAFVSSLATTAAAEPAITEVWRIATSLLADVAAATIVYGAVMVAGAWLAGPMRPAVAVRRAITPYMREPLIAYSLLAIVVAGLVWWAPTPAWRNPVGLLILVGLLAIGVEALRRQMIREFPDRTREVAVRRYREHWDGIMASSRRRGESLRASASRGAQSASVRLSQARTFAPGESEADTRLAQLERLGQLRAAGVLSDDELRAEKDRILQPL